VILHPGILSLIAGSIIVSLMMIYASFLGVVIVTKWDINSSSAVQLALERKTYLISTIMNYVFGFEIFSALLFIYTVDDIHRIFIGAMCATGSLNANPVGWYVLFTKIIILFSSAIWIAINYIDQQADDYPLVKIKYTLVLLIAPIVLLDAYLQLNYFKGLQPDIITSCCGSLFNGNGGGVAGGLASLPIKPTMALFYCTIVLFLANAVLTLAYQNRTLRYALPALSIALFIVSIAAIISFISLYFYEIPTHHCPFDILQSGYHFIGYPLYITLFGGVLFGINTGLVEPFKNIPSLHAIILKAQKKWTILSIVLIILFTLIVSWPILFSSFTLKGYY
jgi:hypothetical protein